MARIILLSGKGGVGKTTIAAATGLAAARRGSRTLVMSFDLAHSLSDSVSPNRELFDLNAGLPWTVAENLDIQEIDVQEELSRHWAEVYEFANLFMSAAGLDDVVAEELAIIPGMEDIVALLYLNKYVQKDTYDVIVVDCPPTTEALRFVSMTTTLKWYAAKRLKLDRNILKVARPLLKKITPEAVPEDNYFETILRLTAALDGIDALLLDPRTTSVRLVTNAERMVVRETQRAYMYFNMYGIVTDRVIVNRLMPESGQFLSHWADIQKGYVSEIRSYFDPVPICSVPLLPNEVVGLEALGSVADIVYADADPAAVCVDTRPYRFHKDGSAYRLQLRMPFVDKNDIDLVRQGENLIVRVGAFKRFVGLPRAVLSQQVASARMEGADLIVQFS